VTSTGTAQPTTTADPDAVARIGAIGPYLTSWLETNRRFRGVPGIQAAVAVRGEVVWSTALGEADAVAGEPLREDHLFRIASHSKTFTGVAVMRLVERGELRLDDTVAQHVPELAETGAGERTLRQLLGHTGGVLRDGTDADHWQLVRPFPDRDRLLQQARDAGVVYDVDRHPKYSNIGYGLVGLVLESVTGRSYAEVVRAEILDPLGLADTGPELDPARAAQYAAGHTAAVDPQDAPQVIPHVDTAALAAATGFYATARDLARYGCAHATGDTTLLSDASKRLMQREESIFTHRGEEVGRYGVGIDLVDLAGRRLVGHSGGYPGHLTRTWVDPEAGIAVVVLTNRLGARPNDLASGLWHLLHLALDSDEKVSEGADLARYEGSFRNLWGGHDVALLGGRLCLLDPTLADPRPALDVLDVVEEGRLAMRPEAGFGSVGEELVYAFDDAGAVASVRIGGMTSWPHEAFLARRASMIASAP
jgi:D-alanyl-D-alanine carboxypeptidase